MTFSILDKGEGIREFTPEDIKNNDWLARRPFVYDVNKNKVIVGKPGTNHSGIYMSEEAYPPYEGYKEGYIFKGLGEDQPDEVGWYSRDLPSNHSEIINALSERYGVPPEGPRPSWDF